jgi:hypothetical protein
MSSTHIKLIAAKNAIRLINHLSTGVSVLLEDIVPPRQSWECSRVLTSHRFRIEGTVSPKGEITHVKPVQARRNCCSPAIAQVENYLCNRGFRTAIGRGLVLAFWTVDSWPRALLLTSPALFVEREYNATWGFAKAARHSA